MPALLWCLRPGCREMAFEQMLPALSTDCGLRVALLSANLLSPISLRLPPCAPACRSGSGEGGEGLKQRHDRNLAWGDDARCGSLSPPPKANDLAHQPVADRLRFRIWRAPRTGLSAKVLSSLHWEPLWCGEMRTHV